MLCRACKKDVKEFFSLGAMPLVNSFFKKEDLQLEKKYNLAVGFCKNCFLAQLTETVPPEELFRHYLYFSSVSSSFLKHCEKTASFLVSRFKLGEESLVLEIASNDGALLRYFKKLGVGILGVDPARNIAEIANKNGLKTLPEFFNSDLAQKLSKEGTRADLIYGANVLAHVPEINDFVSGVRIALKPRGTAIFEFPYIAGLFENKFDTIYHEHVFYYSLIALRNLFNNADLEIYDVDMTPMQGGSLRIYASRPGTFPISDSVKNLIKKELLNRYDAEATYHKLGDNIAKSKEEITALLKDLKNKGKSVAAYGAPAKGVILLNYFGIKNYLDFVVDKSSAKQGLYMPGTRMLIYPTEKIYEAKPDYLLVLCWNIADEVVSEFKDYMKCGGKFIIPIPHTKIV